MSSPAPDRLESWKEIADYLGKGVTTVRRWEREEGLPVRRLEHGKRGSIVAYRSELDAWILSRTTPLPESPAALPRNRRWLAIIGVLAAFLVSGALAWSTRKTASTFTYAPRIIPVTSSADYEQPASLEPNGSRVVYSFGGGARAGIAIKPINGGEVVQLTTARDVFPRWSPNGGTILFSRIESGWLDLMTISPKGGTPKLILRRPHPEGPVSSIQWAAWDIDSRGIFLVDRPDADSPWAIFHYVPSTQQRRQVTFPPPAATGDQSAEVSPDGRMLAFIRFARGAEADVYVVPAAGGEERRLTHDRVGHYGVTWTPDSEHIVYATTRLGPAHGLWRIPADGSGAPEPIERAEHHATWPSIAHGDSPRLKIAYLWEREPVNIRRWDDDPGTGARLIAPSNHFDGAPQYSPDGSRLAFVSNRGGSREIWISDADGNRARQLTQGVGAYTDSPRWSPDGIWLAFSSSSSDVRDIYIVKADGGASARRLTSDKSGKGRPSWSRDGRSIWFWCDRSGRQEIWKTPADGTGAARQMTTEGGFEGFESLDGRWLYFARQRHQLGLWRIPVDGGPEQKIADNVREGWWSIARDAVYFIRYQPEKAIWRLPLEGAPRPSLAATLDVPFGGIWTGFSARADGKSFLYCQSSSKIADLMVLDGER